MEDAVFVNDVHSEVGLCCERLAAPPAGKLLLPAAVQQTAVLLQVNPQVELRAEPLTAHEAGKLLLVDMDELDVLLQVTLVGASLVALEAGKVRQVHERSYLLVKQAWSFRLSAVHHLEHRGEKTGQGSWRGHWRLGNSRSFVTFWGFYI